MHLLFKYILSPLMPIPNILLRVNQTKNRKYIIYILFFCDGNRDTMNHSNETLEVYMEYF